MRIPAWMLTVGLLAEFVAGCSTPRMGLFTNSEPPKPGPEERVRYGNPWGNKPKETAVAKDAATSSELPPDLKQQLASARAEAATQKPKATETLQRAAAAEARGDLSAARAAYLEIVSTDPAHAEAHHRLGVIADMNQDPQTADEHYARAYAANPRDADLLSDMGYSLYLRGRMDASEAKLKEALENNPYHRSAQNNLGLVYGKQGKYDQALEMFRQVGTENEAQRNIAALFPNGRPGSTVNLAAAGPATNAPLPATNGQPGTTAPPFPPDIDHAGTRNSGTPPVSHEAPESATSIAEVGPGGINFGASAGTASPTGAGPQNSLSAHPPGETPTHRPPWMEVGSPASPYGGHVAMNNTGNAMQGAVTRTNPWGSTTANPAMSSTIPRSVDPGPFWQGGLADNRAPAGPQPAQPNPAAPTANPWGSPNNSFPPMSNSQSLAMSPPPGMSANPWAPPVVPQSAPGNSPWGGQIEAIGYAEGGRPGTNGLTFPTTAPGNTSMSSQDMSRWAAQMALGAGPGSMFPPPGFGQGSSINSTMPYSPGAQMQPNTPWGQFATPAPNNTYASPNQWAYAEEVPASTFSQGPHSANRGTDSLSSGNPNPAQFAGSPAANPGANWQNVAPVSPWNDSASTPTWTNTWPSSSWDATPMTATSQPSPPSGTSPYANVPDWPPQSGVQNAVMIQPAGSQNGLPVVTPGPSAYTGDPARTAPPTATTPPSNEGTINVPNWPYAPVRP